MENVLEKYWKAQLANCGQILEHDYLYNVWYVYEFVAMYAFVCASCMVCMISFFGSSFLC